jgi:hypothetical protein
LILTGFGERGDQGAIALVTGGIVLPKSGMGLQSPALDGAKNWPSHARSLYAFANSDSREETTMIASRMSRGAMLKGATTPGALAATSGDLLARPRNSSPRQL